MTALLEAALSYAERGWPVFPLVAGGKAPRIPRRQGGKGHKDATVSPATVRAWWERWPDSNIGIATGQGLAVIDIDPRHDGTEQFRRLCEENRWRPETPEVHTGRGDGGRHLYFSCPLGTRSGRFARRAGVELKADGGYVVAPPSVHESGREYAWHPERTPDTTALQPLPDWTGERLNSAGTRPKGSAELSATVDFLKTIPPPEFFADLAGIKTGPQGGHVRCPAPDHPDRTPSCMVYPNAQGSQSGWFCFGCKRGGSIYDLAGMLAGQPVPLPRGVVFLKVEEFLIDFYTRKLQVV